MNKFSVLLLTAPPDGEGGGAFVKIDGRESLLKAIELFLNRDNIGQIQLVVAEDQMEEAKRKYGGHLGFSGVKLVTGGPRWIDQIAAVGQKISPDCSHVILHDAARPAVAYSDIDMILDEGAKHLITALCAPIQTEVAEVDAAGKPTGIFPAGKFVQLMTPWSFRKDRFVDMAQNRKEPALIDITLLKGNPFNIRLGSGADAALAKAIIHMLPRPKARTPDNPFEEAQW